MDESLVAGLQNALYLMKAMIGLQNKRAGIRSQYSNSVPPNKYWTGMKFAVRFVLITLGVALLLTNTPIWYLLCQIFWVVLNGNVEIAKALTFLVVLAIGMVCAFFILQSLNKSIANKNKRIEEINVGINEQNQKLMQAETQVIQQMKNVQAQYVNEVAPWYPSNYCTIDAAEFFLDSVQNYRADTIKEAINLYEDTLHKRRMEHTQQQMLNKQDAMVKQQQLGNLLAIGGIAMQVGIKGSIDANTEAIKNLDR